MNLISKHTDYMSQYPASAGWQQRRQNALLDFQALGLPTRQSEDWRYFSLRDLDKTDYLPVSQPTSVPAVAFPQQFHNLVFIDGFLQNNQILESALQIQPLLQSEDVFQLFQSEKEKIKVAGSDALEKLNLAYAQQGVVIRVKKNQAPSKPLNIVFQSTKAGAAIYPRVYVIVESGAQLVLCETYVGSSDVSYFCNSSVEILVEKSARLEYQRVQNESANAIHVGRTNVFLKHSATFESLSFSIGSKAARHNLEVFLTEAHSHAQVNGVYLCDQSQVVDNHTNIDFVVGDCTATQLYKGILGGSSRGVFNGRVLIRHGSQKANSQQLNNNLLLSSSAEADSKPQLEIYADDVQAAHGSTVGQLSEEEIFYCLSRGIPREKAVQMLSLGFAQEMLDRVSNKTVQVWLLSLLQQAYARMKII